MNTDQLAGSGSRKQLTCARERTPTRQAQGGHAAPGQGPDY